MGELKYKIERMHQMFGKDSKHICRECSNFLHYDHHDRTVSKCEIYGDTRSSASDWNGRYTACGMFNEPYMGRNIIEIRNPDGDENIPLPGQISFFSAESEN